MADTKITALTALTTVDKADVVAIVDDPAGSPISKKITIEDILDVITQLTDKASPVVGDELAISDSAASGVSKKISITNLDTLLSSTTKTLTNKTLTSPTLTTPVLGTPSSGTLTNCTGLPITGLASGTSANLAGVISDETGSGALVFATSPTLVTPVLGTPTSGTLTNCTGLPVTGMTVGTAYQRIRTNSGATANEYFTEQAGIPFLIDGGGATITTGIKGDIEVPFDCVVKSVRLFADQSGSIVIDIWKDTYANFPPTDADSITASAVPTISTATKSEDSTLTGWTTTLTKGDVLRFNVDSVTTVTRVTLSLIVDKRG